MAKQHSEVADIDRSLYDFRYGEEGFERLDAGLTPEIVREISAKKDEPEWMLEFRLKSLEIYKSMSAPDWGPSIAGLDMDNIVTYVKPNTDQKSDWESLPDDVKNTLHRGNHRQRRRHQGRRRGGVYRLQALRQRHGHERVELQARQG